MKNNFRDWSKLHPGKRFKDFSNDFCISEFEISNLKPEAKKGWPQKKLILVLGSAFAFLIILGITGYYIDFNLLKKSDSAQTTESVLTADWKRVPVGTSNMSLELPFELNKQQISLPDSILSAIDTIENYSHFADKGFKVVVLYSKYKDGTVTTLDAAVNGAIDETKNLQGISNFTWETIDTIVGDKKGTILLAEYQLLVYRIQLKSLIVCEQNHLWQVVTQYSDEDYTGKEAADRILASVEIAHD